MIRAVARELNVNPDDAFNQVYLESHDNPKAENKAYLRKLARNVIADMWKSEHETLPLFEAVLAAAAITDIGEIPMNYLQRPPKIKSKAPAQIVESATTDVWQALKAATTDNEKRLILFNRAVRSVIGTEPYKILFYTVPVIGIDPETGMYTIIIEAIHKPDEYRKGLVEGGLNNLKVWRDFRKVYAEVHWRFCWLCGRLDVSLSDDLDTYAGKSDPNYRDRYYEDAKR